MCCQQVLFYDAGIGYAVHCAKCRHVQIAFGNLIITLNVEEFCTFRQRILEMRPGEMTQSTGSHKKTIRISTPLRGMDIMLNPFELERLCGMLDQADTELKSLQFIGLFVVHPDEGL